MSVDAEVRRTRAAAGVFERSARGLVEVRGADRVRFLQGQLTNDVAGLDAAGPRSGCYALVLTPQGRIVADVHVLARPEALWLECEAALVPALLARLGRYVIADDVALADRSGALARFAVEGPRARAVLESAAGAVLRLAADACAPLRIGEAEALIAAYGESGEPAYQVVAPGAARQAIAAALARATASQEGVVASEAALEVLRVEAGVPRGGIELGEEVLPAEAGLLERAVSFSKGCYTGQEIVARMHSRGRVGHRLVGLALDLGAAAALPVRGAAIAAAGARIGELTSAARSPSAGAIALGFVRIGHEAADTRVAVDASPARVAALPFVAPGSARDAGRFPPSDLGGA